ncbi:protease modulator HflK [Pseudomonas nitroreducens]|uniref:protease modulator HflK n=1 Tax=Pseudomonas nitroreducens TaxID=46680 RepID=UPI00209CFF01|nr:protease modulator HflK [Pseudomonas nitroreducens]MCP1625365.1 regulator of protease activity HflC (stomatin/prohibitin superfamily) [Pseudomonas nitroreducens]
MRVDLDIEAEPLDGLPRFQRSLTLSRPLVLLTWLPALVALLLWAVGYLVGLFSAGSHWVALLDVNAASLLLLGASAQSAWWVARWRARAIGQRPAPLRFWQREDETPAAPDAQPLSGYERWLERGVEACRLQVRRIGGEALWLFGLAGLALLLVKDAWRFDLPVPATAGQLTWIVVGILVASAFCLVVVERHLAAETEVTCPEAESLAAMLRLVMVVQVLTIACLVLVDGQRLWPARLAVLIGLLPGLAAVELLLRALLSVFSPRRPRQEPVLVARSLVAGSLQWPPRPLAFIQGELQQRLGIDLRQVWAFDFMRRAFLPVAALVAVVGWLLTGVVEVPMNGRGVYERFGNPLEVYQPGLHVGLPWPFGKVLNVDNGVIRELATSGSDSAAEPLAPAEGPAPANANRLWDATHLSENSQIIAGVDGGRQSFQIVNMDVRFIYRIGLSDQAALAATYHSTDVEQLLRSIANRVLVHDFAGRTLDGVLGAEREALGHDIGRAVQADLDRLDSGVELLATSVEAIHPPAGAANAYHAVQAAQITAQALIARDRGLAAQQANIAQLNATTLTDKATADAHETTSKARTAELRFAAERTAWQRAGQAFLLEQYLGRLSQGLNGANSLIIDHRLAAGQAPTLDLRGYAAPGAPSLGFP